MSLRNFRRSAFAMTLGLALAACAGAAQATAITMYRDPNCGCCLAWADHAKDHFAAKGEASVETIEHPQMGTVKMSYGVPADLSSCHTAIVDGYVIEGHVPAKDVERLLKDRPAGVTGLAVPGMPLGSPGMEMSGQKDAYQVIAFGPAGRSVWSSYPAGG